ncbi:dihydropteroate synthase [Aquirufa rosea]|uniref:dihydropteroate synthase n=1 Tax=Aquirufa rosea TaxID=2509241 RepID=A0A4Q1BXU7_9BACT|nr:dihydropteroate synthase [Aquirufa rosea]RXK47199.1 dihydropteroate synthase [Aquirufa rosea]
MAIINATPDSFFSGSRVNQVDTCMEMAAQMLEEGASILDIGGHSTRPDAQEVSAQEEQDRVLPIVEALRKAFPQVCISVDTYRLSVAQAAIQAGADWFNDVGGGQMDEGIFPWVAENQVPYILTHSVGAFSQVHQVPNYQDVVEDVWLDMAKKLQELRALGAKDVILDPGFGFSKSLDQNYQLLAGLNQLMTLGVPVLVGVSRKSMIQKVLGVNSENALNGTSVLHTVALLQGAHILRVHDVKEAHEVLCLVQKLQENGLSNLS